LNIILIMADTFRYDNLHDGAEMPVRTPHLDAFRARAVECEGMFGGSFPTVPQRTDMTSGRIGWPSYGWQNRLKSTPNHMPELLRDAGYVSQLICDCPMLFPNDFNVGFDAANWIRGQEGDISLLRMNHPFPPNPQPGRVRTDLHFGGQYTVSLHQWINRDWRPEAEEDRFPPRTARMACEWLEENYKCDPFLLWLDFFDPHEPWDAPEYMARRYDPRYQGAPMTQPNYGKASDFSAPERRNLRAHYCAEAELVDRWVGRVLHKIDDLDLWKNSIVIFTSDHGVSIGEHNRTGKLNINDKDNRYWPLYPEVARVPFLIAAPGLPAGHRVTQLTQSADILPTLLDMIGSRAEPPEPFHGRSFLKHLKAQSDAPIRDSVVAGMFPKSFGETEAFAMKTTPMLYTAKWAYAPVGVRGTPELYNIVNDPSATKNLAAIHPRIAARHHRMLLDWLHEMNAPDDTIALMTRT